MKEKKIELNAGQKDALDKIAAFLRDEDENARVFILKGFAGTGKTTTIKSVISWMETRRKEFDLLASTGRAAKILGDVTGHPAKTIHSEIYSFKGFNDDAKKVMETSSMQYIGGLQLVIRFDLKQEVSETEVYIVDESSMIADRTETQAVQSRFGNGRLLTDLLSYNRKAKFIFVGDPCQLPPISGEPSPALSAGYLKREFGIDAQETTLTEVMRQESGSGLVWAAADVRDLWEDAPENELQYGGANCWGKLPFRNVNNLELVGSVEELAQMYLSDISGKKYTDAAFICKSNVGCYGFSQKFRECLGFDGNLQPEELLLVVQNNLISGFRNGDLLVVRNVSPLTEERAGLTFREIEAEELYTGKKFRQLMMEDLLYQPQANLDIRQQSCLFGDFIIRMKKRGITEKYDPERFRDMMMTDKYLNALRVSFGYALTCHKAQGGEWKNVYSYFPRNIMLNPTKQKYQWVYTAMTRAQEKFFVVDDIYIEGFGRERRRW